ncbi:MAG: MBL fold metallo-hydrolase [Gemmatimonadales bacterium]|nr:MAG: MBL fold metallo-hydrolase [Gemmatimonadales bacterium]
MGLYVRKPERRGVLWLRDFLLGLTEPVQIAAGGGKLPLRVETLVVGAFQSNCFLVCAGDSPDGIVIDPGADPERILARLTDWGGGVSAILLTHAHLDHVGAVAELARATGAPIYLHPADRFLYDAVADQGRMFGIFVEQPPVPDEELSDGQVLEFGGIKLSVRYAPGHSPGGVVFVGPDVAFVGDCVFAGSIGRTDLAGGDMRTLLTSIKQRILTLPASTVLYSGHGPATTVEREARSNPFLIEGGFA